jgi:hypothetical protein
MAHAPLHNPGSRTHRRLPPRLGPIGTLALCAAAMMAHLSPEQLKPAAAVLWVLDFATQAVAFVLALRAHPFLTAPDDFSRRGGAFSPPAR